MLELDTSSRVQKQIRLISSLANTFVVLNDNPLVDIRNSEKIKYVMANGRLYDADSMNEIGNREKPHLRFWWQLNRGNMVNLPVGNNETWLYTSQDSD